MKSPAPKTLLLAVGVVVALTFFAGCEEEQKLPDTKSGDKRSRLIAMENLELKKQLEAQKRRHAREMENQKMLLEQCLQEKKSFEQLAGENVQDVMDTLLKSVSEENQRLRREVESLKAEIERLKGRI
jgi:hypothetical protein